MLPFIKSFEKWNICEKKHGILILKVMFPFSRRSNDFEVFILSLVGRVKRFFRNNSKRSTINCMNHEEYPIFFRF